MGETIKFVLKRIFYFFFDNPVIVAVIIGVIALLLIFGAVSQSCQKRKIERIETNIERGKTNSIESEASANVFANLANNQKEVIKNAENKTNISRNDFNNAVNRDSNSFTGNYREARRKYCEQFPDDTNCR